MPRGGKRAGAGRRKKHAPVSAPAASNADTVETPVDTKSLAISLLQACTGKEQSLVLELVAHPEMTQLEAFRRAGYRSAGDEADRANVSKILRKDHVRRALVALRNQTLESKVDAALMSGDEALQRMSVYARADIGVVLPANHPLKQLPPEARMLIRAVRPGRYGDVIELYDAQRATELMAKAGGKLKDTVEHKVTLEDIVCGMARKPEQAGA